MGKKLKGEKVRKKKGREWGDSGEEIKGRESEEEERERVGREELK